MLPIIFFSVLFGIGLGSLAQETKQPLINVLHAVSETMFKVTHMIMMFAPLGVFGKRAATVANFGFSSLLPLSKTGFIGLWCNILLYFFVV